MKISFNNPSFCSKQISPKRIADKSPRNDLFELSKIDEDVFEASNKGLYGQNIYDEMNCLNKYDPSSRFYNPNASGLVYSPQACDSGSGWYSY